MDPIAIILTIAACIGGLIILYIIGALILFAVSARKMKQFMDDDPFAGRVNRPRIRR